MGMLRLYRFLTSGQQGSSRQGTDVGTAEQPATEQENHTSLADKIEMIDPATRLSEIHSMVTSGILPNSAINIVETTMNKPFFPRIEPPRFHVQVDSLINRMAYLVQKPEYAEYAGKDQKKS